MDIGPFLVEAHLREGRSVAELAAAHGVHRSWLYKLLARYRAEGDAGLVPKSRRPQSSPGAMDRSLEEQIVALRTNLLAQGFDAGALTIHWHLARTHGAVPSVSSVWRVLRRRGLVTPQPHKRPRSSFIRFEAALPNECWQSDMTHWTLASSAAEIVNFIDDHSRLCLAAVALPVTTAVDIGRIFQQARAQYGTPAAVLTDNGAIYTAGPRGGKVMLETELERLGGSAPSTPGRTTPRPAARSSGSTRPRRSTWPSSRPRDRSRRCRPSSIGSPRTTTPSGRTGPSAGTPPPRSLRPGSRPDPTLHRPPTSGSATTRSITTAH